METKQIPTLKKYIRTFLPNNLNVDSWEKVEPFFIELKNREITNPEQYKKWWLDRSELDAMLSEDFAKRYIQMTRDTTNKEFVDSYHFFVNEIEPKIAPYTNDLNKKAVESKFLDQLPEEYKIAVRGIKKALELYREENIPLQTKIATESQKYGAISASMTIEWEGKEITLQKAASILKDIDRAKREVVYFKLQERREKEVETLNALFSELLKLRNKVALNAGFKNYRDYKFQELGRFDYTVDDCYKFHDSIASEILPLVELLDEKRKKSLGLDVLKPWDGDVDPENRSPLKPFTSGNELIEKSIDCFYQVRKSFGDYLEIMREMGHLDLESRKGKAPGGYNYPLYETGVPFIFMNAVGTLRDVVTMVHEGGHAIHSFVTRDLEVVDFKSTPSEVAELASMSMELISMEHWDVFFSDKEELKRAKREQLEKILKTLLWVAAVDKFQHWLYENPEHTAEQRMKQWYEIINTYSSKVVDYKGLESIKERGWQGQLHIFEVPFYYIEYGMAQLGAVAVWRNYKKDKEKALNAYEAALKLGYTKSIPEIYKTAGVKFDFSHEYVKELAGFVKSELEKI